jgi:hypothetical protein
LISKKLIVCVFPGSALVRASWRREHNELSNDDLPTFDRPAKTISGYPVLGYCLGPTALIVHVAEIIFMKPHGRGYSVFQSREERLFFIDTNTHPPCVAQNSVCD